MNNDTSTNHVVVSRPKITLMMVLCGIVGMASAGAATAASAGGEVPSVVVKYDPASLSNDAGARVLYRRIVAAAGQVCPADDRRNLRLAAMIRECREQAIARAVHQIDDPRLAAVYATSAKSI
jgi:UrcA family protein